VNVVSERFADLGIINDYSFTDLFEMKLENANKFPFEDKELKNYTLINNAVINNLPKVKGNTVNSIRTEVLPHIQQHTDIESMEGASFAFVCAKHPTPYAQIRSISNYVGQQDKSLWNIPLAVENLDKIIIEILNEIA
jgi:futalosine hydrolase